ncbi:hypothetical protein C487_07115 [Natrinema pallidum DSM 3751]|uniref:Uncharacterized protein n=2 Tax=Natrinema pallidum TaxID=69527 RepID=L9YZV7_9EURY|nr:hypothetical protein C487_07115 [Natrinema pallidum DSM 3751]
MHLVEDTVVGFVVVIEIGDFDLTAVGIATDDDAGLGGVRQVLEIVLDDLSSEVLSPGVAGNDAVGIGSDWIKPIKLIISSNRYSGMNRQTSLPVAVLVTGIAAVCTLVIATGFLDPDWMLETLGLELYLGSIVVLLGCAVLSFYFDLAGTLRREL